MINWINENWLSLVAFIASGGVTTWSFAEKSTPVLTWVALVAAILVSLTAVIKNIIGTIDKHRINKRILNDK